MDCADKFNIEFKGFADDALDEMQKYDWPGNIRELKNFIESLIVLEKGKVVTMKVLERHLRSQGVTDYKPSAYLPVPLEVSAEQAERELILHSMFLIRKDVSDIKAFLFNRILPPATTGDAAGREFSKAVEELPIILNEREIGKITVAEMEKELIEQTLEHHHGNRRKTAKTLGISERTLYRKIKDYEI